MPALCAALGEVSGEGSAPMQMSRLLMPGLRAVLGAESRAEPGADSAPR